MVSFFAFRVCVNVCVCWLACLFFSPASKKTPWLMRCLFDAGFVFSELGRVILQVFVCIFALLLVVCSFDG